MIRALLITMCLIPTLANGDQRQDFDGFEAHYIILPSTTLRPEIAARYDITRGPGHAFVNVSVLDPTDMPVEANITLSVINLLNQELDLPLRVIKEGSAIYYLATFEHTDRDTLRFAFDVRVGDAAHQFVHQQKMYRE